MRDERARLSRRHAMGLMAAGGFVAAMPMLPALAQDNAASLRLRRLLDDSAAADDALDPIAAAGKGKPGTAVFVDPVSESYARTLRANKQSELAELGRIDRAALPAEDRIAYDVFDYRTRQTLELFESGLFEVQRKAPLDASFGLQVEFPDFVSGAGAPFANAADYERGLQRLAGFADFLENNVVQLKRGLAEGYVQPKIIVANVLAQVDAMLKLPVEESPFYAAIKRMPASIGAADRQRFAAAYRAMIAGKVYPGYRLWQSYLRDTYLPAATDAPGRWAMKDGAALYARDLARHTTTTRSAEDIHALGLSEVARIRGEMEAVRAKVGFQGDLKAFFEHVRTDPKYYYTRPEDLLARFKAIEAKIWPGIPTLFHDRPKAPFEVRPLPALGDQRGTGYYRPGPPDGVSPGILFFNMSMLNTRPIPTLETLTLHEGIPGHHFQLTLAQENAKLPPLLRNGQATAYTEGWGLYAESLGPELGMFTDPMQWFGHLDMEMLRAVRLVVDTGIHAKRWGRQQAIDYMLDNTSMAPRDVAVEIDRYISYPGQACAYKIGELKFRELRERSAKALGAKFDIRGYHHQVLDTGALPMAVLEAKVDGWIKAGGGRG
ncbi:Uncharacterized conserved protein, DUF885 familyt [Sphingomonas laterariae]|uniref:Uncharacterized conserved protein, DUF885 familyt n=1 Tax=Edaphosphingomonas laterariae TaxID=861865 RepID=A0A239EA70_9SPHN|nr:DUF885 domain-containing protein [Sphingomonas laterariae]SNS41595.1 Uncharacterized conserved protein, DUF885 familyt [Sphingomonas laterariae]